jgi:hypothetical protein
VSAPVEAVAATGYEIGLLSLSSPDYSHILELVQAINEALAVKTACRTPAPGGSATPGIKTFSVDLMEALVAATAVHLAPRVPPSACGGLSINRSAPINC